MHLFRAGDRRVYLPGDYLLISGPADYVAIGVIFVPYLLAAFLAWLNRGDARTSRALFLFILLVALAGVILIALEATSFRSQLATLGARGKGPEYFRTRLPRVVIVLAPVVQGLAVLLAGIVLLVQKYVVRRGKL